VTLVIDSSITLAWFFEDERSDHSDAVLREVAKGGAVVPSLWRLEVANALQSAVRHKRIGAQFRDATLADLHALPIAVDSETDRNAWGTILNVADRTRLTLHDAAYIELAQRLRLPLASLDKQMRTACRGLRVALRPTPE
jgi:predicted nucleic acid-binding protein